MKVKLDLLSREQFSELSLHAKNDYLQDVAARIAQARGQTDARPLPKESLPLLRRFYSRRRRSDLALEATRDPDLRAALTSFAEALHLGEVKQLIAHETPSGPTPTLREPPPDDAQLSFFVPSVHDAPLKDDINLMDIAPFSLAKTVRHGSIRYELKDAVITIEGGAEVGIVTAYDYDIFIHMISHLAWAMRQYRIDEAKGLRPSLPPRTYRPSAAEILTFCRRGQGGKQYEQLEYSLDRLQATRYKITRISPDSKRRAAESFPLISRYKVVSRTRQDKIDQVEIDIPDWVYTGVVTPHAAPSILTLNTDYFLIAKPLARYIYRIARKSAGQSGVAEYGLETLHHRSGSMMPFRKFRESVLGIVEAAKTDPFPDYDLVVLDGKNGEKLRMVRRVPTQIAA